MHAENKMKQNWFSIIQYISNQKKRLNMIYIYMQSEIIGLKYLINKKLNIGL